MTRALDCRDRPIRPTWPADRHVCERVDRSFSLQPGVAFSTTMARRGFDSDNGW